MRLLYKSFKSATVTGHLPFACDVLLQHNKRINTHKQWINIEFIDSKKKINEMRMESKSHQYPT